MSMTNLRSHVKINHKRDLKEVLKEQGREYVYAGGTSRGRGIVGISGIEVRNVGPVNTRKPKGYQKQEDNLY